MKSLQDIGAKMYQQAASQQGGQPGPDPSKGSPKNDGNVYDADYTDVD